MEFTLLLFLSFIILSTVINVNCEELLEDQEKYTLAALSSTHPYNHKLKHSPTEWIELKLLIQESATEDPGELIVMMQEETSPGMWKTIGKMWNITLDPEEGFDEIKIFDMQNVNDRTDKTNPLRFHFVTTEEEPIGISYVVLQLGAIGRQQVWIAGLLLILVYLIIVFELLHRTIAALIGAGVSLIILSFLRERPSLAIIVTWIDEGTIGLLLGMMIIVGVFSQTGFFEWGAIKCFKWTKGKIWRLVTVLCLLTAVLSAFLDNVTTILLVAPVTLRLATVVKLPPVPIILAEVFFSNIGGTATLIGDPPNIIIGSMLSNEIGFVDFIINLSPAIVICCPFVLLFLRIVYRNKLEDKAVNNIEDLENEYKITNMKLFVKVIVVLFGTITFFFLEPLTHVEPAWVAMTGAAVLLMISTPHEIEEVLEKVEWSTLLFFSGLFIFIEALKEMGLIRFIGDTCTDIIDSVDADRRLLVALVLIMWISAVASAFIDNIPYTATMVPVIVQLSNNEKLDLPLKPLAWALAFGACLGGNGTLIGASANVVACSIMDGAGYRVTFLEFMKYGFPVLIITVSICCTYMILVFDQAGFRG